MLDLKDYITEYVVSRGTSAQRKDMTVGGICSWLEDLGLKPSDIEREIEGYEMFVDEVTGNLVVRAKFIRNGKEYVMDTWFDGDDNAILMVLYELERKGSRKVKKTLIESKDMKDIWKVMKEVEKILKR